MSALLCTWIILEQITMAKTCKCPQLNFIPDAFLLSALALVLLVFVWIMRKLKKSLEQTQWWPCRRCVNPGLYWIFLAESFAIGGPKSSSSGLYHLSCSSPLSHPGVVHIGHLLAGPHLLCWPLFDCVDSPEAAEVDFAMEDCLHVGLGAEAFCDMRVTGLEVEELECAFYAGGTNSSSPPSSFLEGVNDLSAGEVEGWVIAVLQVPDKPGVSSLLSCSWLWKWRQWKLFHNQSLMESNQFIITCNMTLKHQILLKTCWQDTSSTENKTLCTTMLVPLHQYTWLLGELLALLWLYIFYSHYPWHYQWN